MIAKNAMPARSAHSVGIRKGEGRARPLAERTTRVASDTTGVNLSQRGPIHPKMPQMPPA